MDDTSGTAGFSISSFRTGFSYDVDFDYIDFNVLPSDLRQWKLFSYLQSIYSQIKFLWVNTFLPNRYLLLQQISINGQTIILEKWLRTKFNNQYIYISNFSYQFYNTYIYDEGEVGDVADLNTYIENETHSEGTGGTSGSSQVYIFDESEIVLIYDFTVHVPIALINLGITIAQITAEVNKYKSVGTNFNIEIFL